MTRATFGDNLRPARLGPVELCRLGASGLRTRPLRVVLSACGIAIGIAAMLAVVGISSSSRAELDRMLARLGTNLLTVSPGNEIDGQAAALPQESISMVSRIGPVQSVAATGEVDAFVYRHDHVPKGETGSIAVAAAQRDLLDAVGATVAEGVWFNPATAAYPSVVLGATAADRLDLPGVGYPVWLGGEWFAVVGILRPVPLAPELDSTALVGWDAARSYLGFDGHPTMIYVRAAESQVAAVASVLGRTANPAAPSEVRVSRPSDALAAKQVTDTALRGLLLGLGAVALVVGGVGVANTMVISVLERRAEVGLRRALGATRGQIRGQFLAESLLLCSLGGAGGALLGVIVTAGYASVRGWPVTMPVVALVGGLAVTLVVGVVAGIYPAVRASQLAPTVALAVP